MTLRRWVLCLTAAVLASTALAGETDESTMFRYDGYRAIRVVPESWDQIEQLHGIGARLLGDAEGLGPVDYYLPPEAMADLAVLGVKYEVLHENIQEVIDAQRARIAAVGPRDPNDPAWFDNYHTLAEIEAKLQQMVSDRPDLCTLIDIGDSIEGRDIWCLQITGPGSGKPGVLFNGTQHAREWIAGAVNMYIADQLVYQYDSDPAIHSLVDRVVFYIIPVVNPDGYSYTWTNQRLWRKNRRDNWNSSCYGVDLNRNWDAGWSGPGASGDPCDDTYYGTSAFSEPETAAMRDFFIAHPEIVSCIDYHSYSEYILSPYGYTNSLPADNATFMELDEAMHDEIVAVHGHSYVYGPIYSTIYQASGGSVDWAYDSQGVYAFTIELRPQAGDWLYGFELPPEQIIPTSEENFPAAMLLAEWSSTPVVISFPNGHPTRLVPNTAETLTVKITEIGADMQSGTLKLYSRVGSTGSFTESALTSLGGNLYEATLPGTPCGRTLQYYVGLETTGGQPILSPADAPASFYEVTAAPIVALLNEPLDSDPGWTVQTQWAFGQPTGGGGEYGGPDPTSGYTGLNVYGYNLAGDYANSLTEKHLTTTAIDCTGATGVTLSFWRWLGVEQPSYDHAYVRVSNNGSTWTTVWTNTAEVTDSSWTFQEFDISAVADNQANVMIRWTMGTTDSGWRYCGWNIDDIQVWAADPDGCPNQLGDLNCDGSTDVFDIDAFVLAITDAASYAAAYPDCDVNLADCDNDGAPDVFDIDAFVMLITGG
ncbi:MAG: choice-of-anchor J domain-containing protein [Phycisphaerae bacterium]|nr:choice-of-anchor J domain-containing protein [Phycisphaerae bacterium]